MNEKPAKRRKREKIYSAYSFDVVKDHVRWPNGQDLDRDLIVHRHNISVFVPILGRDKIILIRQFRYGAGQYLWELPAGTIGRGESPLSCAKREIVEEVGYQARRWKKLAECFTSPGYNTETIHCFAASELVLRKSALEEDEILEPKIFSITEVREMVRKKNIVDTKSLISLFYFFGAL